MIGGGLCWGKRKGRLSLLWPGRGCDLAGSLGRSRLTPTNSEVSAAGRKERGSKGHLEVSRQVGPFPLPDRETTCLDPRLQVSGEQVGCRTGH